MDSEKLVIRTSDRLTFLKCRTLWDLTSKIRKDWEPLRPKDYFDLGLAWHAALERWYNPDDWELRTIAPQASKDVARQVFLTARATQMRTYVLAGVDDPEQDQKFNEDTLLGEKMLANYFEWSLANDHFTPIFVEKEFEVPIRSETGRPMYYCNETLFTPSEPCEECIPVVYQGRVDGLVKTPEGHHYILEHKTAGQLGSTNWLAMDDQVGSYIWALREMLRIDIRGVIHTTTVKRAPERPKMLKSGFLSIDKRQATDLDHFFAAIYRQHPGWGEEAIDTQYGDMLKFLASDAAPVFIRRNVIDRSQEMVDDIGKRIYWQAQVMLSDPIIYPTISPMNCNGCSFYGPCLAIQDGSDWMFMLRSGFKKRKE